MNLVTLSHAAAVVGKTPHNIRDYIQRGRITKYDPDGQKISRAKNGGLRVDLDEVRQFLKSVEERLHKHRDDTLIDELNFFDVAERERTKHVHRLHPYLGKFIPQLVEWFLKRHFKARDLILDPFAGSGTTLVQANEQEMDVVGIDSSEFNCRIARVKTAAYNIDRVRAEIREALSRTRDFSTRLEASNPDANKRAHSLLEECASQYLKDWFAPRALVEILYYRQLVESDNYEYKNLLRVLLSRAARSSRLIAHDDLATPKKPLPVGVTYRCRKHDRMCTPIDNAITKINAYSEDTARRIEAFSRLQSDRLVEILQGDSRTIDLEPVLKGRKIAGIFTSPPYVGQIDYHDQHVYAYELFRIERNDKVEIGSKRRGKSSNARREYVESMAEALKNVSRFLEREAKIVVVANDRFRLYPEIASQAGLSIIEEFHRAVTKRTEKGDNPYRETIFLMRSNSG